MAKNGELGPVRLNRATMKYLLNGGLGMQELLRADAEAIAARARAIADGFRVSGEYADSIRVEQDKTDRARFRIIATARHVPFVERKHSVLARAVSAGQSKKHLTGSQKSWRKKT